MRKIPFYVKKDEKPMSIGVFLSGSGTNFTAVAEYQSKSNLKEAAISFVFSNVPDCPGIKKAEDYGIKTYSLSSKQFFADLGLSPDDEKGRNSYDSKVLDLLSEHHNTDLIVLAGYRRKLSPVFYDYFGDRIINMYPGDITRDYLVTGVPASLQAIRNKDSEIACTVYIDNKNTRFGEAITRSVPVSLEGYSEDNVDELDREIREKAEWTALPYAVFEIIAKERLSLDDDGSLYIDDIILPPGGLQLK